MVRSKNDLAFDILVYAIIIFVGLICLFPILYVVSASVTPYTELLRHSGFVLIPSKFTLTSYKLILEDGTLYHAMWVTIKLTVIGTLANLIFTLTLAYPLSRSNIPGTKNCMRIIAFCMLFHAGIVPTYLMVRNTGLLNTLWAMILPSVISIYNLVIMKAFFEGLPEELFEAARIDGANEVHILTRMVLPMSLPIIMTIGMYYAVDHWNAYMVSVYYITKDELRPLQVILRRILETAKNEDNVNVEYVPTDSLKMAAVCFVTAPIIVIYPFIQKYFVKGTLAGAVKG